MNYAGIRTASPVKLTGDVDRNYNGKTDNNINTNKADEFDVIIMSDKEVLQKGKLIRKRTKGEKGTFNDFNFYSYESEESNLNFFSNKEGMLFYKDTESNKNAFFKITVSFFGGIITCHISPGIF